jgi:integrase
MSLAGKQERYLMRAAGIWDMRQQIRKKLTAADRVMKYGEGMTTGTHAERVAARGVILGEALKIAQKLDKFRELPWMDYDRGARQEASHKKSAGTDQQLARFFEAVGQSQFRDAFLVAEFTGCRGVELGKGIRIEEKTISGKKALSFFINSAKCDGDKKGLDVREMVVPFPSGASVDVQERWNELAAKARRKSKFTVVMDATEKQTTGQRFTQNFRSFVKKAGLSDFSGYSLRHRVSCQTKSMGDAENTALVLGHQTTETQRHYGRVKRGRGGISPVEHFGINASAATIRGGGVGGGPKPGPALHVKERIALRKAIAGKAVKPAKKAPRL